MEINTKEWLHIRPYKTSEADIWDQYLLNHSEGNFYQRYDWKGINSRNFGHDCYFMGAEKDGQLVGLFPMIYIQSRIFGKILSSMPFVNYGGLCSDNNEITEALLKEAKTLTTKCDADFLEIRSLKSLSESMPDATHKISMTLDLDADADKIWNGFKSKHRTNIRRVYKNGITVKQGRHNLLDIFYKLISQSWRGLGTPIYKKSYFKDILDTFPNETKIFVAYKDGTPIATAFNGYYKGVVEGMWAGALPKYRKHQPNYVLYWEMIKDACENNFEHFHLGRSTVDTGAEAFKKKWNAHAKQLHWQYILNKSDDIPQLNVSNPKFQLAIKVWSKLPLSITTKIGPLVARSIP